MFKIISLVLSLFFLAGAVYCLVRLYQIRKEEKKKLGELTERALSELQSNPANERWAKIMEHIGSEDEGNWRLAIVEADIILGEMMTKTGYTQETISEKLKSVEKSDFNTIEKAWEAHKIRNTIAHEGSKFILTKHEAKRVINLYKEIFEEFEYL